MKIIKKFLLIFLGTFIFCTACSKEKKTDENGLQPVAQETLVKKINDCPNLTVADSFVTHIPEDVKLYEMSTRIIYNQDFDEYYASFLSLFSYLFPGRELDASHLYYGSDRSVMSFDDSGKTIRDYDLVEDYREDLKAKKEGNFWFVYDENRRPEERQVWNSPIAMELGSEIGYGGGTIQKGVGASLVGKSMGDYEYPDRELYPRVLSFHPEYHFPVVGQYEPDSKEAFLLQDSKIAICDAADFVENYINNMPCNYEPNLKTSVMRVEVLQVDEEHYAYGFTTTGNFEGVNLDYVETRSFFQGIGTCEPKYCRAWMFVSNDVDIIESYLRRLPIESRESCDGMISAETAIERMSEYLTDNLVFEVMKMELVYSETSIRLSNGFYDMEGGYPTKIRPAWKFVMNNPNDNRIYVCYVDAEDGRDYRYYYYSLEE